MHNFPTKVKKTITIAFAVVALCVQTFVPLHFAYAGAPFAPSNSICYQDNNKDRQCFASGTGMPDCEKERASAKNPQSACEEQKKSLAQRAIDAVVGKAGDAIGSILATIAEMIFNLAGSFLAIMGYVLDMAIARTIDHSTYADLQAVNIGWAAMRDFSNLFFIFALLYIAIKTILGDGGGKTKTWVANLIIAAVLINFSLFGTKVIIDAGNVLAVGLWSKITVATPTINGTAPMSSATAQFMQGFRIQTNFDAPGNDPGAFTRMKIYIGGAILMLIAGYLFLVGAMMMIVRTVTLLIVMILSPFAFLGFALPVGGSWAGKWWSNLLGSTFVAPVFLAMLYIDSVIIQSLDITKLTGAGASASLARAEAGNSGDFAIFYNFFILGFLLLASLTVADSVSSGASRSAIGYLQKAKKYSQNTASGAIRTSSTSASFIGRNTAGRFNKFKLDQLQNDKEFQNKLKLDNKEGRDARARLARTEKLASSTYDIRNAPLIGTGLHVAGKQLGVNTGTGTKANALADDKTDKKDKQIIEDAKRLFAGNDEAQARYIKEKMRDTDLSKGELKLKAEVLYPGSITEQEEYVKNLSTTRLEQSRHKATKDMVDAALNKAKIKEDFDNAFKPQEELSKLEKERDEFIKSGDISAATALDPKITDAKDKLAIAESDIEKAMKKLASEDVAKLMNKDLYRDSEVFKRNLKSKDLQAINKLFMEGKYNETIGSEAEKMMEELTLNALRNPKSPDGMKKMIKDGMKNGGWGHTIDFNKEITDILANKEHEKPTPDPTIVAGNITQLNEMLSMLSNEEKAELGDGLLDTRVAERLNGAVMAMINKKGTEGIYNSNPDFEEQLKALYVSGVLGRVAAGSGKNTAEAYINKNKTKADSFFSTFP
jgi:hypothetical protein